MKLRLYNDFHNTSVDVIAEWGKQLTLSQMRRIERKLCGVTGCKCGALHRDNSITVEYTGEENGVFLATLYPRD